MLGRGDRLALDLRPETVKTRLHRARRRLRTALQETLAASLADAFPFLGVRCERMTEAVMQRLAAADKAASEPLRRRAEMLAPFPFPLAFT